MAFLLNKLGSIAWSFAELNPGVPRTTPTLNVPYAVPRGSLVVVRALTVAKPFVGVTASDSAGNAYSLVGTATVFGGDDDIHGTMFAAQVATPLRVNDKIFVQAANVDQDDALVFSADSFGSVTATNYYGVATGVQSPVSTSSSVRGGDLVVALGTAEVDGVYADIGSPGLPWHDLSASPNIQLPGAEVNPILGSYTLGTGNPVAYSPTVNTGAPGDPIAIVVVAFRSIGRGLTMWV